MDMKVSVFFSTDINTYKFHTKKSNNKMFAENLNECLFFLKDRYLGKVFLGNL